MFTTKTIIKIFRSKKWTQTWLKRFIAITVSSVCLELTELCHQMSKTRIRINVRVVWMGWTSTHWLLIAFACALTVLCLTAGLLTKPYIWSGDLLLSLPNITRILNFNTSQAIREISWMSTTRQMSVLSHHMCGHRFVHLLTTIIAVERQCWEASHSDQNKQRLTVGNLSPFELS